MSLEIIYAVLLILALAVFFVVSVLNAIALYLHPPVPGAYNIGVSILAAVPISLGLFLVGLTASLPVIVSIAALIAAAVAILSFAGLTFIQSRLFRVITVSSFFVAVGCIILIQLS